MDRKLNGFNISIYIYIYFCLDSPKANEKDSEENLYVASHKAGTKALLVDMSI